MLKTSEFSCVRSTNEKVDVVNSRDEIYLVFTKKSKFSFYFILFLEDLLLIDLLTMHNVKENKGVFVTEFLDHST